MPPEQMRLEKQALFADLHRDYEARKSANRRRLAFDAWFDSGPNNAHLVSVATYEACVPGLQALLEEVGNDLPAFYSRARELADKSNAPRRAQLCNAAGDAHTRRAASRYSSSRRLADFAPMY
jgi:predicted aminopeptidase